MPDSSDRLRPFIAQDLSQSRRHSESPSLHRASIVAFFVELRSMFNRRFQQTVSHCAADVLENPKLNFQKVHATVPLRRRLPVYTKFQLVIVVHPSRPGPRPITSSALSDGDDLRFSPIPQTQKNDIVAPWVYIKYGCCHFSSSLYGFGHRELVDEVVIVSGLVSECPSFDLQPHWLGGSCTSGGCCKHDDYPLLVSLQLFASTGAAASRCPYSLLIDRSAFSHSAASGTSCSSPHNLLAFSCAS